MVHTVEERVRQQLGDLYGLVRQAMEICQLPAGPYMYAEALESDEKELKKDWWKYLLGVAIIIFHVLPNLCTGCYGI